MISSLATTLAVPGNPGRGGRDFGLISGNWGPGILAVSHAETTKNRLATIDWT